MLNRYVRRLVYRGYEQLNRRQIDALLAQFSDDAYFQFPGDHEFALEAHSKAEIKEWFTGLLRRLPSLTFDVVDVVSSGPPWNLRVCTRYTARTESATGTVAVYEGMEYSRVRWRTVVSEELFPDTQAFADYLDGSKVH